MPINPLLAYPAFFLGFGFLIFVHELGHFLVAKWVGIRCTQFAVGFGHALACWRKGIGWRVGSTEPEYEKQARALLEKEQVSLEQLSEQDALRKLYEAADRLGLGETEYRLNWMPLGGYVKMLGQEDLDPEARSNDPRSFNTQPVWARACVISAGVVMNLIFAVVFFVAAFMAGVQFPAPVVGAIQPGGPAALAFPVQQRDRVQFQGLKPGDRILSVDGEEITDFLQLGNLAALSHPDHPLEVEIERPGYQGKLTYLITPAPSKENEGLLSMGIGSAVTLDLQDQPNTVLPEVLSNAGVLPGMRIITVAGEPVERLDQFEAGLASGRGEPVDVTFLDHATGKHVTVYLAAVARLALESPNAASASLLGLIPATEALSTVDGSPAEQAGIQPGDLLAQVGAVRWPTVAQLIEVVTNAAGAPIQVDVLRAGQLIKLGEITPHRNKLGIALGSSAQTNIVAGCLPDGPTDRLHLPTGSRLLSLNEHPIENFTQLQRHLQQMAEQLTPIPPLKLGYELGLAGHPTEVADVALTAAQWQALANASWGFPVSLDRLPLKPLQASVTAKDPWHAAWMGVEKTHQTMMQTYQTLASLFRGTVAPSNLRGPVGIVQIGGQITTRGWSYLMFFLGLISVNLVVLNFLPIPILDGGLMLFLLIEKLKGSPLSGRVQSAATIVGLAIVGCLALTTFYFDLGRLVSG